jgi:transketolase
LKYKAFGWEVIEVIGHEFNVLDDAILEAQKIKGKPTVILMKTNMGHGVDFMSGTHKWHGVAPNDEELSRALSQLEETLGDY